MPARLASMAKKGGKTLAVKKKKQKNPLNRKNSFARALQKKRRWGREKGGDGTVSGGEVNMRILRGDSGGKLVPRHKKKEPNGRTTPKTSEARGGNKEEY